MSQPKKASMDTILDPREPIPFTAEVTSSIEPYVEEEDTGSPFLPIPREALIFDDTVYTPAKSAYPDRPLANASSSGSLTERPARHGCVNFTTITEDDVTKWTVHATFGSQTPDDQELGIETHVVCMLASDVEAASTENRTDHAAEVEATKTLKKHGKSESLHQVFKETVVDQKPQALAAGDDGAEEFTATEMSASWAISPHVLRCGQCGGQMIGSQVEGNKLICLDCGMIMQV